MRQSQHKVIFATYELCNEYFVYMVKSGFYNATATSLKQTSKIVTGEVKWPHACFATVKSTVRSGPHNLKQKAVSHLEHIACIRARHAAEKAKCFISNCYELLSKCIISILQQTKNTLISGKKDTVRQLKWQKTISEFDLTVQQTSLYKVVGGFRPVSVLISIPRYVTLIIKTDA